MNKKEHIIKVAADLFHEFGYHNVGIKKILDEVQIPKGSFYHYFKSKEALALDVIEYHLESTRQLLDSIDNSIEGLKTFLNIFFNRLRELDYNKGCAIGNLILEISDSNESFRTKLLEWIQLLENGIYNKIKDAKLSTPYDKKALSSFIVSCFEGAIMKARLEKNHNPLEEFHYFIFKTLLK